MASLTKTKPRGKRTEQVKTTTKPPTLAHFLLFVQRYIKDNRTELPLELLRWQIVEFLKPFFEWDASDDRWVYPFTLFGAAKKSGKTGLMAMLALFWLWWRGFPSCIVCFVAASDDQADKAFYLSRRMVEMSPGLQKVFKVLDDKIVRRPEHGGSGFIYRAPCSVNAIEGENVKLLIGDQLEGIQTPRQEEAYDASIHCVNGHHDGRVVWFSHSGAARNGIIWREYERSVTNCPPGRLFIWKSPDPLREHGLTDGDKYKLPENLLAANPSLGHTASLAQVLDILETTGEAQARQRFLCEWPPENPDWVTREMLVESIDPEMRKLRDPLDAFDPDLPVYVGIDLSHSNDASAVTALQPIPDGDDWTMARMSTRIWQHPNPGLVVWVVPYLEVIGHLQDIYRRFKAKAMINRPRLTRRQKNIFPTGALMACDPKFALNLVVPLSKTPLRLVNFVQTDANMVPATDDLRTYFTRKRIIWDGNPKFIQHMMSVVLKEKASGQRINRDHTRVPRTYIDGAISSAIAVRSWVNHNHGKQEIRKRRGPTRIRQRRRQITRRRTDEQTP